jgi:hypothetical protein
MKLLRPIALALLLAGAFFYFTTWRSGRLSPINWPSTPPRVEITEAASGESLDSKSKITFSFTVRTFRQW